MKKILINTLILLSFTIFTQAQTKEDKTEKKPVNSTVKFKLKDVNTVQDSLNNPKVYVNGKLFNFELSLIDPKQIESMSVIKGEEAIANYNAPQGVILIKTKTAKDSINMGVEKAEFKVEGFGEGNINQPLFFVDGKQVANDTLKKISPDDIESITVLKDKSAKTLYNAENGVIIITTKKKKD
jgi:TonB-dependent SusC/RagA subfamily outer membrane receptor